MPVSGGVTPLPEPAAPRERLPRVRLQRAGGRVEAPHHGRLLAHGAGHPAALAIAAVRHDHLPRLPLVAPQMFTPATVGDLALP